MIYIVCNFLYRILLKICGKDAQPLGQGPGRGQDHQEEDHMTAPDPDLQGDDLTKGRDHVRSHQLR